MKTYVLFVFFSFTIGLSAQDISKGSPFSGQMTADRSLIQLYDSVLYWSWDSPGYTWKFYYKYCDFVYDANRNLTGKLSKYWNGANWVNSTLYTYSFDSFNNMVYELKQDWNGTSWENNSNFQYSYDASRNRITLSYQSWTGSSWKNVYMLTYSYDSYNNQDSELQQNWNGTNWVYTYLKTSEFNTHNQLTRNLYQTWTGSYWENNSREDYSYDNNQNLVSVIGHDWVGSDWVNLYLFTRTYFPDNKLASVLEQKWEGGEWKNYSLENYEYDESGNRIYMIMQFWNGSYWTNRSQDYYTYDANNFVSNFSHKSFDGPGNLVLGGDSTCYFYQTVLGTDERNRAEGDITVYPNPSAGVIMIDSEQAIEAVEVFNLPGKLIYSRYDLHGQASLTIDLSGNARGMYFLVTYSGSKNFTRKLFIQ